MSGLYNPAVLLGKEGPPLAIPDPPSVSLQWGTGTSVATGLPANYRIEAALDGDFRWHSIRSNPTGLAITFDHSKIAIGWARVPFAKTYRVFRIYPGSELCIYEGDGRDIRVGTPGGITAGPGAWKAPNDFVIQDRIQAAQLSDTSKLQGWALTSDVSSPSEYELIDLRPTALQPDNIPYTGVLGRTYRDTSGGLQTNVNNELVDIQHHDEADVTLRFAGYEFGTEQQRKLRLIWNARALAEFESGPRVRTFLSLNYQPEVSGEFDPFRAPVTWREVKLDAKALVIKPKEGDAIVGEVEWLFRVVKPYQTLPPEIDWGNDLPNF